MHPRRGQGSLCQQDGPVTAGQVAVHIFPLQKGPLPQGCPHRFPARRRGALPPPRWARHTSLIKRPLAASGSPAGRNTAQPVSDQWSPAFPAPATPDGHRRSPPSFFDNSISIQQGKSSVNEKCPPHFHDAGLTRPHLTQCQTKGPASAASVLPSPKFFPNNFSSTY